MIMEKSGFPGERKPDFSILDLERPVRARAVGAGW
jgi:hypothetical protein